MTVPEILQHIQKINTEWKAATPQWLLELEGKTIDKIRFIDGQLLVVWIEGELLQVVTTEIRSSDATRK